MALELFIVTFPVMEGPQGNLVTVLSYKPSIHHKNGSAFFLFLIGSRGKKILLILLQRKQNSCVWKTFSCQETY